MTERILVPFDGSPLSQRALERALSTHPADEITVLYVFDPVDAVYEAELKGLPAANTWEDRMTERADALAADATAQARSHDREITTATDVGRPARTILTYATDHDVDHIIMGSHGREGMSRVVLGSVAERVMRRAPMAVTVVR